MKPASAKVASLRNLVHVSMYIIRTIIPEVVDGGERDVEGVVSVVGEVGEVREC